jgi:hypothetical protein
MIKLLLNLKKECPLNQERKREGGQMSQNYPRRLLNRLKTKKSWVLMFIYNPSIPFTNNQIVRFKHEPLRQECSKMISRNYSEGRE